MVHDFIYNHDVWPLSGKRHFSDHDNPHPKKKQTQINYDREQAKKCMMDDWLGPIPIFPDKSFEAPFVLSKLW